MNHEPDHQYFTFSAEEKQRLKPTAAFDVLINNADRKGGHVLVGQDGHYWLIDHGVCFHVDDKLRTVIWDFAGEPVPAELLAAIQRVREALEVEDSPLRAALKPLLNRQEIRRLAERARSLLEHPVYPFLTGQQRPYPWPPV
ncbi:hypothetical protein FDZ74_11140 [bacterium]|nr:MAG: hypothetical protein FDZ74_11140 [bacterium]